MPDTENPEPKESEAHNLSNEPAPLTTDEFHVVADHYLDELVNRLEDMQESTEGLELDYSVSACGRVRSPPLVSAQEPTSQGG